MRIYARTGRNSAIGLGPVASLVLLMLALPFIVAAAFVYAVLVIVKIGVWIYERHQS